MRHDAQGVHFAYLQPLAKKTGTLGNCCVLNSFFVYVLLYIYSSRHHTTSGKIVNLHIYGEET